MFIVMIFIFLGIGTGYALRTRTASEAWLQAIGAWAGRATTWLIWLLLFMLGIEVGANERIISALPTLGVEALLLSLSGLLCCCTLAWVLWRMTRKGGEG